MLGDLEEASNSIVRLHILCFDSPDSLSSITMPLSCTINLRQARRMHKWYSDAMRRALRPEKFTDPPTFSTREKKTAHTKKKNRFTKNFHFMLCLFPLDETTSAAAVCNHMNKSKARRWIWWKRRFVVVVALRTCFIGRI